MTARDDYPRLAVARPMYMRWLPGEVARALDEIDRLRQQVEDLEHYRQLVWRLAVEDN